MSVASYQSPVNLIAQSISQAAYAGNRYIDASLEACGVDIGLSKADKSTVESKVSAAQSTFVESCNKAREIVKSLSAQNRAVRLHYAPSALHCLELVEDLENEVDAARFYAERYLQVSDSIAKSGVNSDRMKDVLYFAVKVNNPPAKARGRYVADRAKDLTDDEIYKMSNEQLQALESKIRNVHNL